MKHNIRTSIVIGLVVIAMCSFVTGCANKKDSAAANSNDDLSNKSSQVENQLPNSNDESSSSSSTDFQAPEEGYYSNDYDEILKIQKSDDNTYNIEYSITLNTALPSYFMLKMQSERIILKPEFLVLVAVMTAELFLKQML